LKLAVHSAFCHDFAWDGHSLLPACFPVHAQTSRRMGRQGNNNAEQLSLTAGKMLPSSSSISTTCSLAIPESKFFLLDVWQLLLMLQ